MPLLKRPRQPLDERLPNGQSVYHLMGALSQRPKSLTLPSATTTDDWSGSNAQDPRSNYPISPQPSALSQVGEPPPAMEWNPIVKDQYGKPSVSPTAKGSRSDILERQFEAQQAWEPQPHGNRLVGALKGARDAVRLNARPGMSPGELIGTAIGGLGVGAATRNPDLYSKEIEERKTLGDLSTALGVEKERASIANASMVPISVPDGRGGYIQTMVPQGKAATTLQANEKTRQGQQKIDETAEQNKAHRDRWAALGRTERKRQITNEYKAGMLRTPAQLQDAADELEIPGELQPAFIRGEMRDALDAKGNLIEVNRKTGAVTTPTQDGQAVQSYEVTKEAGRAQRAKEFLAASMSRQQTQIAAEAGKFGSEKDLLDLSSDYDRQAKEKQADASRVTIKTQADLDRQRQLNKDAADLRQASRNAKLQAIRARGAQGATQPAGKKQRVSSSDLNKVLGLP